MEVAQGFESRLEGGKEEPCSIFYVPHWDMRAFDPNFLRVYFVLSIMRLHVRLCWLNVPLLANSLWLQDFVRLQLCGCWCLGSTLSTLTFLYRPCQCPPTFPSPPAALNWAVVATLWHDLWCVCGCCGLPPNLAFYTLISYQVVRSGVLLLCAGYRLLESVLIGHFTAILSRFGILSSCFAWVLVRSPITEHLVDENAGPRMMKTMRPGTRISLHTMLISVTWSGYTRCFVAEISCFLRVDSIADIGHPAALRWFGCQVLEEPVDGGYPDHPQDRSGGEAAPSHDSQGVHHARTPGSAGTRCTYGARRCCV